MALRVLVLIGSKKGLFIAESDAKRASWALRGPYCETWPIMHGVADEATGTIYAGGGNAWFAPGAGGVRHCIGTTSTLTSSL